MMGILSDTVLVAIITALSTLIAAFGPGIFKFIYTYGANKQKQHLEMRTKNRLAWNDKIRDELEEYLTDAQKYFYWGKSQKLKGPPENAEIAVNLSSKAVSKGNKLILLFISSKEQDIIDNIKEINSYISWNSTTISDKEFAETINRLIEKVQKYINAEWKKAKYEIGTEVPRCV
jgi:formiminotetrahydrofolate cyclodeaminase